MMQNDMKNNVENNARIGKRQTNNVKNAKIQNNATPFTSTMVVLAHAYASLIECAQSNCKDSIDTRHKLQKKKIAALNEKDINNSLVKDIDNATTKTRDCIYKHCHTAALSTLRAISENIKEDIKFRKDNNLESAPGLESGVQLIQKAIQNKEILTKEEEKELFALLQIKNPRLF